MFLWPDIETTWNNVPIHIKIKGVAGTAYFDQEGPLGANTWGIGVVAFQG